MPNDLFAAWLKDITPSLKDKVSAVTKVTTTTTTTKTKPQGGIVITSGTSLGDDNYKGILGDLGPATSPNFTGGTYVIPASTIPVYVPSTTTTTTPSGNTGSSTTTTTTTTQTNGGTTTGTGSGSGSKDTNDVTPPSSATVIPPQPNNVSSGNYSKLADYYSDYNFHPVVHYAGGNVTSASTALKSVGDFFWGFALSVAENLKDPFFNWVVEKATGRKIEKAPVPSDLNDMEAYYKGRIAGDIFSIGISLGQSAEAIVGFLTSLTVGVGATTLSGGLLAFFLNRRQGRRILIGNLVQLLNN